MTPALEFRWPVFGDIAADAAIFEHSMGAHGDAAAARRHPTAALLLLTPEFLDAAGTSRRPFRRYGR